MRYYAGLDVSVKSTAVCIVDETGKIVKERSLATEPESLADWLAKTGLSLELVGHEAGGMSAWLQEGLARKGLPVVCIDARHMATALAAMNNKTDRNDARGIVLRASSTRRPDDAHGLVPGNPRKEPCGAGVAFVAGRAQVHD